MKVQDITLTASELGEVLNLTARRIRQYAEEGVFQRVGRNQYPLAANVQAYIAATETPAEGDDLRRERVALVKAQTRRIELENAAKEGTAEVLDWQDATIDMLAHYWALRAQPVSSWLHAELQGRMDGDTARVVCGQVANWLIGIRKEVESDLKRAAAKMRSTGTLARDYWELGRLIGRNEGDDKAAL